MDEDDDDDDDDDDWVLLILMSAFDTYPCYKPYRFFLALYQWHLPVRQQRRQK